MQTYNHVLEFLSTSGLLKEAKIISSCFMRLFNFDCSTCAFRYRDSILLNNFKSLFVRYQVLAIDLPCNTHGLI